MSRAPGSGSRARSREIGYAEAMSEIGFLLKAEADRWQNSAGQQIDPVAHAALTVIAGKIRSIGDLALATWELHQDHNPGTFARDVEHLAFLAREYNWPPARREFPYREQSDSN